MCFKFDFAKDFSYSSLWTLYVINSHMYGKHILLKTPLDSTEEKKHHPDQDSNDTRVRQLSLNYLF